MDHRQRATAFSWVFDSATYTLGRALEAANISGGPLDDLEQFRSNFDGRRFTKDEVAFHAKWTPAEARSVFALLVSPLNALASSIPAAATAHGDLTARLATIAASPNAGSSDLSAVFDELLVGFLHPTLVSISVKYWEIYRERVRGAASADADRVSAEQRLLDEVRFFYTYARTVSKANDVILGSLVEEFLRAKIASLVHPLQVSSGGIYGLAHIAQMDCIIWDRRGYPPAIEIGQFAVVAPETVKGIVEVKASYDSKLAEFAERILRFTAEASVLQDVFGMGPYPPSLGVLVWTDLDIERVAALGGGMIVPLFQRVNDSLVPNLRGMQCLLHFLRRLSESRDAH